MIYKNPLTALVLAGVAGLGTSAYAVDLDSLTPGTAEYAEELAVPVLGLTLDGDLGGNAALNVVTEIGFGLTAGDNHSFRVDIAPAVFDGDPAIALACGDGGETLTSGGDGADFVIFDVTGGIGGCSQTDETTFEIPAVEVGAQSSITVVFGNYQTATGAANQDGSLYENSGTLLEFSPAFSITAEPTIPTEIDVTTNSTLFVGGGDETLIGQIVAEIDTDVLWSDGLATESGDLLDATEPQLLIFSGDFSAAQDLAAGVPDGNFTNSDGSVFADATPNGACDAAVETSILDATDAIFDVPGVTPAEFTWDICYNVNGVSAIVDGPTTGAYDVTAETGSTLGDQDLGVVSVLDKNGSTASANFVLTPGSEGGVFRNWIRVCNNSSISGRVFVRLDNDLGNTVAFDLADVSGQAADLGANECTGQILVDDLFAEGQATDPTFDVGANPRNKLRAEFEGEFDPIAIDNITVSRDNNTFGTFQ